MIITLASFKGGVAKSTTAIHLAALLQESAPTVLVDHDQENRSVTKWYQRGNGEGLKFRVIDHFLLGREGRNYTHIVIDTKAAPGKEDLENLVRGSDLLIIPCFPEIMALDTMVEYRAARNIPNLTPVRLALPVLDDGPHLNYAVQWFTFATIALVGVGTMIAQDLKKG